MKLPEPLAHLTITDASPETITVIDNFDRIWLKDLVDESSEWEEVDNIWPKDSYKLTILAVTPMHPGYGIRPESLASIGAAIANYDGQVDWLVNHGDNPYVNAYENVTYHHNKARQLAMSGHYDAILSIEADMIVPPDTISRLLEADADIAYGLYVSRHKPNRWLAYKTLDLWGAESISLDHTGKDAREAWGNIIDVAGVGMGCTLIKRKVFEKLRFRLHDGSHSWINEEYADDFYKMGINPVRERKRMVCDDYLLAMDAQHYGLTQRCNTNLVCGHMIDGSNVIWPDPEAESFYRVDSIEEL
jgi:hypothetical protein